VILLTLRSAFEMNAQSVTLLCNTNDIDIMLVLILPYRIIIIDRYYLHDPSRFLHESFGKRERMFGARMFSSFMFCKFQKSMRYFEGKCQQSPEADWEDRYHPVDLIRNTS